MRGLAFVLAGVVLLAACSAGADLGERPASQRPVGGGPVGYAEARAVVMAEVESGWDTGSFCLDDRKITENDAFFVFDVGAKEYIVDGDHDYAFDGGVPVVYKKDGRLEWRSSTQIATDDSIESRDNPNPTEPLCG